LTKQVGDVERVDRHGLVETAVIVIHLADALIEKADVVVPAHVGEPERFRVMRRTGDP
jgi:hypothetical protein